VVLDKLIKIECSFIGLDAKENSSFLCNLFIKLSSLSFSLFDLFVFIIKLMILVSILPMWPFEINQTLGRKLSFAVSTFPVCIVSQAADVHVLSAALIGAYGDLMIRVQYHFAHAAGFELRDESLG
jgi:hypothetical protein